MKALIILATLFTLAVSAQAETSQILRQTINPAHLDPSSYRGGVIELNDDIIKLSLFVQPINSKGMKEVNLSFTVYEATRNDCNEDIYKATNEDGGKVVLVDRTEQNCDDVVLFPIRLEYTTTDENDQKFISTFDGSNFVSLAKPTGRLKLGTTPQTNLGVTAMLQVVHRQKQENNPVVLPIVYDK